MRQKVFLSRAFLRVISAVSDSGVFDLSFLLGFVRNLSSVGLLSPATEDPFARFIRATLRFILGS